MIGIIGTGWGVRIQVPAFRSAGLHVHALAGSNEAKTRQIAEQLGVDVGLGDWQALLALPDVQLVSIVTPPHLHADMAIAALEAGKHVLCEKPTALGSEQAQRMLDIARQHPRQLALIDHELRFLPSVVKARNLVTSGAIGAVQMVRGQVIGNSRADPARPWNWWSSAEHGGGMLGAIASHQIDLVGFILGHTPTTISASLHTFVAERPGDNGPQAVTSDDSYSLRLRYRNTLATLTGSVVASTGEPNTITLYGTTGTLRWQAGSLLQARADEPFVDITPPHEYAPISGQPGEFPHATVYLAHALRAFLEGQHAALANAATFQDGVHIQMAIDAARLSHEQHGVDIALPV